MSEIVWRDTKKKPNADARHWLKYVRSLPCVVHGEEGTEWSPIVAHHIYDCGLGGGASTKPHDIFTIPMTNEWHVQAHASGWHTFEFDYHINQPLEVLKVIDRAIRDGVLELKVNR